MNTPTMRAATAGRIRQRPKTYGGDRVCGHSVCETKLSRYNRDEYCFRHAPARFPRMRGEFTEEYAMRNS